MTRNLKVVGLALVAMLAMTAFAASAAQAGLKFTAGATSGKLKATQTTTHTLKTSAGSVTCTTATQEGSFTAATFETETLTPSYSGCKAFGFLGATVTTTGCTYVYSAANVNETLMQTTLDCNGGSITVSTTGCVMHIPDHETATNPQTLLKHIKYSNNFSKSPGDVDATLTITGLTYIPTSGCPGGGSGEIHHDGEITGAGTFQAFNTTGDQVSLTVSHP